MHKTNFTQPNTHISELLETIREAIRRFENENNAIAIRDDFLFFECSKVKLNQGKTYIEKAKKFLSSPHILYEIAPEDIQNLELLLLELKSVCAVNMQLLETNKKKMISSI